jgi:hypothetical protein
MGYMFKNGSKGIGYYLDSQQQQQQQQMLAKGNDKVNEYSSKKKDKDSVYEESFKKEASSIDPSHKRSRKDNISG